MADEQSRSASIDLEQELRTVKAEVDALQIAAMKNDTPWYGNASTLIAAFALLISLGSTIFTYMRSVEQENWALRAELRTLILRLNELPLKNHELQLKYKGNRLVAGDLAGLTNNENLIVASQAAEIIGKIPWMVSGGEALSVAVALKNSNQLRSSTELLLVALQGRNNTESMVAILRNLAGNNFLSGNLEEGRKYFQKALNVFRGDRFRPPNKIYEVSTHALTEMYWAQHEAQVKNCDAWEVHLRQAREYWARLNTLRPGISGIPDPVGGQIEQTASLGCNP